MGKTHRVLLITTGGSLIAGLVASERGHSSHGGKDADVERLVSPAIDFLNRQFGLNIELETVALYDIESSDLGPTHWSELAGLIAERYDDYDSFIVFHGRSTLGYTAAALSFALANPNKPILLTGCQLPFGVPGSDCLSNIENALRLAVWSRHDRVPLVGVFVVWGGEVITGTRVRNTSSTYDSFESSSLGKVGRVGRVITINELSLQRHLGYLSTNMYPRAHSSRSLICQNDFDMRIASLTEFPGMSMTQLSRLANDDDVKGFIIRSFGAGAPSSDLIRTLEHLRDRQIPVVITSQTEYEISNFLANESGIVLRNRSLAIPAYDMSIEAQTTKLGWLLARQRSGQIGYEGVCAEMVHDLRGEIQVMWDVG